METVEVKLLKYTLRFRQLSWREELSLKFPEKEDRRCTLLAHALADVSGLKVTSPEDALKVMKTLPESVIHRVFIVYRGSFPPPRIFTTTGLFKAPEPNHVSRLFEEEEEKRDQTMDKVEEEMRQKFGSKELEETKEVERQMLRNSKMRGLTKATPDENKFGATPPVGGVIGSKKKNVN
jgi:hypothetical protein